MKKKMLLNVGEIEEAGEIAPTECYVYMCVYIYIYPVYILIYTYTLQESPPLSWEIAPINR